MKAYKVYCTVCEYGVYVFTENANKAKLLAHKYTGVHGYNYCEFINLRAHRLPQLDCEYRPREFAKEYELDWCNLEDRRLIAKHGYCYGQVLDEEHEEWRNYCDDCEIKNECPQGKELEEN